MPSKRPASDKDIKLDKPRSSDPDPDPKPPKKPHKNPNPNSKHKSPDPPAPKSPSKPKPSPPMNRESSPEKAPKKRKARDSADDEAPAAAAAATGSAGGKSSQPAESRRGAAAGDDAVALLRGAIEFRKKTGLSPTQSNLDAFYESVKDSLHAECTRRQIYNKLRHLRHKYNQTVVNGPGNGPNDALLHELSAEIWGGGEGKRSAKKKKDSKQNGSANLASNEIGEGELEASDWQEGLELEGQEEEERNEGQEGQEGQEEEGNEEESRDGLDSLDSLVYVNHVAAEIWEKNEFWDMTLESALKLMKPSKVMPLEEKWKKQMGEEMKTQVEWTKAVKDISVLLFDAHRKVIYNINLRMPEPCMWKLLSKDYLWQKMLVVGIFKWLI